MVEISILDKVLDEKYWDYQMPRSHYSGHMYRNSPFETDDSCGNCDGARCDYCRLVVEPAHFDCSITCDALEKMLLDAGVPADDANNIVYSDSCGYYSGEYYLHWPQDFDLQEKHKEFFDKLNTVDEEIFNMLDELDADDSVRYKFDELKNRLGINNDYNHPNYRHVDNQYSMWRNKKLQEKKKESKR